MKCSIICLCQVNKEHMWIHFCFQSFHQLHTQITSIVGINQFIAKSFLSVHLWSDFVCLFYYKRCYHTTFSSHFDILLFERIIEQVRYRINPISPMMFKISIGMSFCLKPCWFAFFPNLTLLYKFLNLVDQK